MTEIEEYEPPFHVEADELGIGWDNHGSTNELLKATRYASRLVRSWQMRGDERRVRILDKNGKEL